MIWFAWRQFRTLIWIAGSALIAVAALLTITGHNLAGQWAASGAATCHSDCGQSLSTFLQLVNGSANGLIYQATLVTMYVVPALIGIFWGAPLIAREIEAGTLRLAWNQSVTRTRWLATKLAIGAAAAAATIGLLTWAITAWAHHIDHAKHGWIAPWVYGARGIVPIGYALFSFALGVTLGMLIRRTVPAMAATLAVYVAAVVSMRLWIRVHLVPTSHVTPPLDLARIQMMARMADGSMLIVGNGPQDGWTLSNSTITPSGQIFVGPADPQYCGASDNSLSSCWDWLSTLGLRQDLTYHPASHFWPLQLVETGIFVAAALGLVGFCFWWTRRRLT